MTKKTQRKPAQPAKEDPPKKDTTVTIRLNEDDKSVLAALHLRTGICSDTDIVRLVLREACEQRGINHLDVVENARLSRDVDASYGKENA